MRRLGAIPHRIKRGAALGLALGCWALAGTAYAQAPSAYAPASAYAPPADAPNSYYAPSPPVPRQPIGYWPERPGEAAVGPTGGAEPAEPADPAFGGVVPATFPAKPNRSYDLLPGPIRRASYLAPPIGIQAIDRERGQPGPAPLAPTRGEPVTEAMVLSSETGEALPLFRGRDDLPALPGRLLEDLTGLIHPEPLLWLGGGIGLAATANAEWDDRVRASTAAHPNRWGDAFSATFDVVGHPITHLGAAGLAYSYSLWSQDQVTHEFSLSLLEALILTDATVAGLKYAVDRDRPDGDPRGFPSGHTASSFAVAALVEEQYGLLPGLGAYSLASLVAWQRIDDRKHDLSDVLFGAGLGLAIGKAVGRKSRERLAEQGITLMPYAGPEAAGVLFEKRF